jgi:hypothetical protein
LTLFVRNIPESDLWLNRWQNNYEGAATIQDKHVLSGRGALQSTTKHVQPETEYMMNYVDWMLNLKACGKQNQRAA